jgi:glutamyl-tRNA reductase
MTQPEREIDSLLSWSLAARDDVAASLREAFDLRRFGSVSETLETWKKLGSVTDDAGLFYLGTCHRIEVHAWGIDPRLIELSWEKLAGQSFPPGARLRQGATALIHLARVAASLESEVLGETQVTGQLKEAASEASYQGLLSAPLSLAVQQALRIAKKVRTSTRLGEGTISVAHVAVDGLRDFFEDLGQKEALVVGAGSMALQSIARLKKNGIGKVTWINRSQERVLTHPTALGCSVEDFKKLPELVWAHPISVFATRAPHPIFTKEQLTQLSQNAAATRKNHGPQVILDLGLPRNVDEKIHGHHGFYVRNVDEFTTRAQEQTIERMKFLSEAESIVEREAHAWIHRPKGLPEGSQDKINELRIAFKSLEKQQEFGYFPPTIYSKLLHRVIEELRNSDTEVGEQVLETLVRAWRLPEEWLSKSAPHPHRRPEA